MSEPQAEPVGPDAKVPNAIPRIYFAQPKAPRTRVDFSIQYANWTSYRVSFFTSPAAYAAYRTTPVKIGTGTAAPALTLNDAPNYVWVTGTPTNRINTLGGADILVVVNANAAVNADLGAGDDIAIGAYGNDSMDGSDGADFLDGNAGNDKLLGGKGDDTLRGGLGNDSLYGGEDNDILHGGDGDDVMFGGAGNDTLYGDKGDDSLTGGDGNDSLYGGNDNDTLRGGEGNDLLNGDNGNDSVYGELGNDALAGGAGNDTLFGGVGNDTLFGNIGNDELHGDKENDQVDGGAGNDILWGDGGNDTVWGRSGDDTLIGGAGNNTLWGGTGADVFVFSPSDYDGSGLYRRQNVEDFEIGVDKIDLRAFKFTIVNGVISDNRFRFGEVGGTSFFDLSLNPDNNAVSVRINLSGVRFTDGNYMRDLLV